MAKEKPVAALEITNKSIKLVIGFVLGGKVYTLYSLVKNIGDVMKDGVFIDENNLISNLTSFKTINDDAMKLKISISEIVLSIPPHQLEVFQTQQVTTVIGEESRVADIDLRNLYTLIHRTRYAGSTQNRLVDIIPDRFILDQGRTYLKAPLGESTTTLTLVAKVHRLPEELVSNFEHVVSEAGFNISRSIAAPFAALTYINSDPTMPADYILVDTGAKETTISFIGNRQLFNTFVIPWGGDNITNKIAEAFGISEAEAERLKISFGLTTRELNFNPPIVTYTNENGEEVRHYPTELAQIIKKEVDNYISLLNDKLNEFFKDKPANYRSIPMVLSGGNSLLKGLKEYMLPKVQSSDIKAFIPSTLGCRNPIFTNCLGMILVKNKYQDSFDDERTKINPVNRN